MSYFRLRTIVAFGFTLPGAVLGDVVINEIHYDANPKTDAVEFVELHNAGGKDVDLSGWRFSNGIQYTFPANTTLEPDRKSVV